MHRVLRVGFIYMAVKDLLSLVAFEEGADIIKLHYGEKKIAVLKEAYYSLKKMSPAPNTNGTTIYINAFLSDGEDAVCLNEFDELNNELYFDVSAYEPNDDIVYSIVSAEYRELLGYHIDEQTQKRLSAKSILAHILWEATAFYEADTE